MAAIATGDFTGGNGQYLIKASLSGAPNLQASSTICVRVKNNTTSTTLATVVADFCDNALASAGACFGRNSGVASTAYNTYRAAGSSAAARSTCYGNTTTWYHCTFVYNASTAFIRFYIDGVFIGQQASATTVATSSTANSLIIGWHPGKFADAAIWNRALTDAEVAQQAAFRVCQVTSGLLGFWRLDSNGNDTSGNGQTFTAGGTGTAVTYSTADNPPQLEDVSTGTGSCSTSGTVTMTATKALGTCTGSASTSGAASVAMSNLAASGGPGKEFAWADVLPTTTGEGYRFPSTTTLFAGSSNSAAAAGAALTFMAWVRWRAVIPAAVGGSTSTPAFIQMVGNTNVWAMDILAFTSGGSPSIGGYAYISNVEQSHRIATVDYNWHHVACTYSAGTMKVWIDGAQSGTDITVSFPTSETGMSFNLADNSPGNAFCDVAHMKAWVGKALNSTEIAAEIASYPPVTDVGGTLRAYYPLARNNPGWDAVASRDLTSITHGDDDAATGPPGTWPSSTANGSTSTAGTASVNRILALGSCTGSASTSGAATLGVTYAVGACTGATSTSATAQLNRLFDFASSGATSTSGAAAVSSAAGVAASGSTSTAGSTSFTLRVAGSASTSGSAAVAVSYNFASSGAATTSGSAAVSSAAAIAATGSTQTTGSVPGITLGISASGGTSTAGTAATTAAAGIAATGNTTTTGIVNNSGSLASAGATQTTGAASFGTASFPESASGSASTSGAAGVLVEFPLSATGGNSTAGNAAMPATAGIAATGSASTSGATMFALYVNGVAQTTGAASLSALAALTASGSSSTSGAAAVSFTIASAGQTTTSGTAAISPNFSIVSTGSTATFGNAAFAGVAPPGGGAGGVPDGQRRWLGAIGARRAVR
jgi:hypothetical protein